MRVRQSTMAVLLLVLAASAAIGQEKAVTGTSAWVAEPATGAVSTSAYVVLENPTMYDVYVVKVLADVAAEARIVESGKPMAELTIPSFGSTELEAGKAHIELSNLKRPLVGGDRVVLTLTTDQGATVTVEATVRKPS